MDSHSDVFWRIIAIGCILGATIAIVTSPQLSLFESNCDKNYSPCVPNVIYDLNCAEIGYEVTVTGNDVNKFDEDDDGMGCENYRLNNWFWPTISYGLVGAFIGGWVALPVVMYLEKKDSKNKEGKE